MSMLDIDLMAREVADGIIAYGLSELVDLLPDGCIRKAASDDSRFKVLSEEERGKLFDAIAAHLDDAAARYRNAYGRMWTVQDGPNGPVESLTTFWHMEHWLQAQQNHPPKVMQDLLVAWCRAHPRPTHDSDPRGRTSWAQSYPVELEGGGFASVAAEVRRRDDGETTAGVEVTRLPYRELSLREARSLTAKLQRLCDSAAFFADENEDSDDASQPEEIEAHTAEPDSGLSTGAAFLVNAIQNARVSDIQAAFRHLGWALNFDIVVDEDAEVTP